jgi:hypothetical protein
MQQQYYLTDRWSGIARTLHDEISSLNNALDVFISKDSEELPFFLGKVISDTTPLIRELRQILRELRGVEKRLARLVESCNVNSGTVSPMMTSRWRF